MWIWSCVSWLPRWREQRRCVWSHTQSVSPRAHLQPTRQHRAPPGLYWAQQKPAQVQEQRSGAVSCHKASAHRCSCTCSKCCLQSGLSFPVHFCHDPHPKNPIHSLLNGSFFSVAGKSYFRNYGVILIVCISALWKTAIAVTILP